MALVHVCVYGGGGDLFLGRVLAFEKKEKIGGSDESIMQEKKS